MISILYNACVYNCILCVVMFMYLVSRYRCLDVCVCKWWCIVFRGGSKTAATSKVELFMIIVNGFQPLTIITKSSTLDVTAVLDPPLVLKNKRLGKFSLIQITYKFSFQLVRWFNK